MILAILGGWQGLKRDTFLESMQKKYAMIESYKIFLGSCNKRALFIEYRLKNQIDDRQVEACFEDTKSYALSYREKSKYASAIKEIYIRFIDSKGHCLEYSSFYDALGDKADALDQESIQAIDAFSTWYVYRE